MAVEALERLRQLGAVAEAVGPLLQQCLQHPPMAPLTRHRQHSLRRLWQP